MTKYLYSFLLFLCTFHVNAQQSIIGILYKQCQNISEITISNSDDLATQLRQFELQSLAINNVSDSLNYLRQYPLNSDTTETLINCQMKLSKTWEAFMLSDMAKEFTQELKASGIKKYKSLADQLTLSRDKMLPEDQLAKLRTMEAIFRSNLKPKIAAITVNKPQCFFNGKNKFGSTQKMSIANYLLNHPSGECRKSVWSRYYERPYITKALDEINQIRQRQARDQGYADFTHFVIANNYLDTPELIHQYLNKVIEPFDTHPWDIGHQLKSTDSPAVERFSVKAIPLLLSALNKLKLFSIEYDFIENQVVRLWYRGHLLGDINLIFVDDKKQVSEIIRYPVLGYQYGQARLVISQQLTSSKQKEQVLTQLANVLSVFFRTSQNYLTNGTINNNDYQAVALYWLSNFLISETLNISDKQSARKKMLMHYLKQLKVTRAKLALNFYLSNKISSNNAADFESLPTNYLYGFDGLIDFGPNYFAELWQRDLSAYLYKYAKHHAQLNTFFEHFVINESQTSFEQNLTHLFGRKIKPEELIVWVVTNNYSQTEPQVLK